MASAHSRGLGFGFNVVPVATGQHINMESAQGVTFVLYEDGGAQSTDFKESVDGASAQALTVVNDYFANSGIGTGAWTYETADADATLSDDSNFVKKDTTAYDCAVIYIDREDLSDGFNCVEATIDGAGICIAIVHPLQVQRTPANLPVASAGTG